MIKTLVSIENKLKWIPLMKQLKVLVLDDRAERHIKINSELIGSCILFNCYTLEAAKKVYEKEKPDFLLLDRDLDSKEYTGEDFVEYMINNSHKPGFIFIHSINSPAAKRMYDSLKEHNFNPILMPFISINYKQIKKALKYYEGRKKDS